MEEKPEVGGGKYNVEVGWGRKSRKLVLALSGILPIEEKGQGGIQLTRGSRKDVGGAQHGRKNRRVPKSPGPDAVRERKDVVGRGEPT